MNLHGAKKEDHFMVAYQKHFAGLKPKRVLEIGVQGGGSLKIWRDMFPEAEIVGVDVLYECKAHEGERIKVEIGDQTELLYSKMSYTNPQVESSYQYNNLGKTLYEFVLYEKPDVVIDFGVLNGYSTIALAMGCKFNGKGKVKVYDLFEDYEYQHSNFERLVRNIKEYGLTDWVEIEKANFFDWIKNPEPFGILHLDISNTGDIIDMLEPLRGKGTVLFEGGSEQRDHVGWMLKFNKKPIRKSKLEYQVVNPLFPSISKLI